MVFPPPGIDLIGGNLGGVGGQVAGDLAQTALLSDRDGRLVERHAAADRHEVALAGLHGDLGRVEERRIAVVDHDVPPVDAPRRVAPRCKGHGLLHEFLFESGLDGVGGVVEHRDVNGLVAHSSHRRGTTGPGLADLTHAGPLTVGGDARRERATGRRRRAGGSRGKGDARAREHHGGNGQLQCRSGESSSQHRRCLQCPPSYDWVSICP